MANFYSYILVICFISRCRELVTYTTERKPSLTHSIHNYQFLDFILSDMNNDADEHQSITFFKGHWQLSFTSNELIIANEKLSSRFAKNLGRTHVKMVNGIINEVQLFDGQYQDRSLRLLISDDSARYEFFNDF